MSLTSLSSPSPRRTRARPRLVCLDLQREYVVPGRPLYADGAGRVAEACVRLLGHARRRGWRVVHVQRRLADGLFDRSGYFAAPIEGLQPLISEPVFAREQLSAFGSAEFCAEMRDARGQDVYLAGFALAGSCLATAYGAVDAGLHLTVVSDAAGAAPARGLDHRLAREASLLVLGSLARIATSGELMAAADMEFALS
jgi:nicotinamidase-related amidase